MRRCGLTVLGCGFSLHRPENEREIFNPLCKTIVDVSAKMTIMFTMTTNQTQTKEEKQADRVARRLYQAGAWNGQIDAARARFTRPDSVAAFDAAIFDEQKKRYGMK